MPLAVVAATSGALLYAASRPLETGDARGSTFSVSGGRSKKQTKGMIRARANLKPQVLEIPLEEPLAEEAPRELLPEQRLPYTLHMVTQFPNHKHLSEDGPASKYLERKLVGALDHMEDMIKHVELQLKVEENFHREKDGHKKTVLPEMRAVEMADGEIVEDVRGDFGSTGTKVLAPYKIKVVVSLKNHRVVVYSNPEKHAEQTLTEAADGMADGLRRLLREEKEKEISARRHARAAEELELDTFEDEEAIDEIGAAEDAEAEALYTRIEAVLGGASS